MAEPMRIDLHTHSNRSDGTDSPAVLVRRAKQAGLDVLAITDHDVADGWVEAQVAADEVGIELVRGMEISTECGGVSVHLLAYEFDPLYPPLRAELDRVLASRVRRAEDILARLAEHGVEVTPVEVAAQVGQARAVGRPHIADAMVAKGYVRDRTEAFDRWLADGRPGHVAKYGVPLVRAVELVGGAGGRTVIAHPWSRSSRPVVTPGLLADLRSVGLAGIEVDHHDHRPHERAELRSIAADLGLVVTGSSDHHGTGKSAAFGLGSETTDPAEFLSLLGAR